VPLVGFIVTSHDAVVPLSYVAPRMSVGWSVGRRFIDVFSFHIPFVRQWPYIVFSRSLGGPTAASTAASCLVSRSNSLERRETLARACLLY